MGELYSNPRKNQALFAGSLFWGIGDDQGLSVCQLWERGTRRCSFANYVDQVRVGPGEEDRPRRHLTLALGHFCKNFLSSRVRTIVGREVDFSGLGL